MGGGDRFPIHPTVRRTGNSGGLYSTMKFRYILSLFPNLPFGKAWGWNRLVDGIRKRGFWGKSRMCLGIWLVLMVWGTSCDRPQVFRFTRFSMDTLVEYTVVAASGERARQAVEAAHREIRRIDSLFWEENPNGPVFRWNHSPGEMPLPREVAELLRRSLVYSRESGGAFDVTIKPVLDLYPFGREHPRPPSIDRITRRLSRVGWQFLKPDSGGVVRKAYPDVQVALGGVAKGYAVDRAVQVLRNQGIRQAIVNAGGDLYCLGNKAGRPWVVGVRHPRKSAEVIAVLRLQNRAVATSGDYQRFFWYQEKRYHHILDPRTGRPARKAQSATVVAPTTEQADALATALFVLGPRQGLKWIDRMPEIEAMVVDSAGTMHYSRGFQKYLYPKKEAF